MWLRRKPRKIYEEQSIFSERSSREEAQEAQGRSGRREECRGEPRNTRKARNWKVRAVWLRL
jgi:hypothetical protein